IGPLARSADDCALVLAAIAGHDADDPGSLPAKQAAFSAPLASTAPAKKLRVGWLATHWTKLDPAIEPHINQARKVLERFADVRDATLPDGPWEAAAGITIACEAAAAFADLIESGGVAQLADPAGRSGAYANLQFAAPDYLRAQQARRVLEQKMNQLYQNFDVLACASLPAPATKVEANLDDALTFPDPLGAVGNLVGLPAISVPCGLTPDKLPAGIQLVGRAPDDATVLAAAQLSQQHTG